MITPAEAVNKMNKYISRQQKTAAISAFLLGLLIHLPVMLSDIPNHDGLDSLYFDQNMITSGRWFLTIACGFSSYFTVPWMIGLLGLVFLGLTAAVTVELLEIRSQAVAALCGGILVAFPALASTFAYVFTLDGYMMAMLLAALAVLLTKKYQWGFLLGAQCLAFSMGIYQAYLPFAVLLCLYQVVLLAVKKEEKAVVKTGKYLGMGVLGALLYYGILKVLLLIQGKELASYQGIDSMHSIAGGGILNTVKTIYRDFLGFTFKGNVLFQNVFSLAALLALLAVTGYALFSLLLCQKWYKSLWLYVLVLGLVILIPPATSCILLVSPEVTYHLLMRYQWVVFLLCMLGLSDRFLYQSKPERGASCLAQWILLSAAAVLLFCYALTDNIAYANLEKRYEKTYAYCLRLLDRIEQTEGYYPGIPIAMIGVVGDEQYPETDLTGEVTSNMTGLSGDGLLYTGNNYEAFIKHYLGATLNVLDAEVMGEIYYTPEYMEMETFPGASSTKVVDGVLYVKTENSSRD